jgi:superfamily I DNA/RNA helicase
LEEIERVAGGLVAEGVRRMRKGEVRIAAGYDGEYGTIRIFAPEERERFITQTLWTYADEETRAGKTYAEKETDDVSIVHDKTKVPYQARSSKLQTPSTKTRQPATSNEQQVTSNEQPATSNQQPATSNQQPASAIRNPKSEISLNPSQRQAVIHGPSHLLIVAGPGTGKTHTLTNRIGYVVEHFAKPEEILAITFTNKAAEEMRQRLVKLAGPAVQKMTVGTFHAFCLSLLRQYHEQANLPPDFEILSEEEQRELAKELWPEKSAAERDALLEEILRWKAATGKNSTGTSDSSGLRTIYDSALRESGKLDFDDLLVEAIRLLDENSEVRNEIHGSCRWIFVDEYQDLNPAQHLLLTLLVHENAILTAIGDPNQAIYGFRGADVTYFSRFAKDFAGATELRLAENYRSAPTLLTASAQVIEAGPDRFKLPLSPTLLSPGRLTIHAAPTDKAEAEYVVHQIEKMVGGTSMFSQDSGRVESEREGERSFGDFAVFYRLNALRPALEEALGRSGMPYQISGDAPLLSRRGARELVTAICLLCSSSIPKPPVMIEAKNLARLLQFSVPGFGEQTAQRAEIFFKDTNIFNLRALIAFTQKDTGLNEKQKQALIAFSSELQEAGRCFEKAGLTEAIQFVFNLPTWKGLMAGDDVLTANYQRVLNLARARAPADGNVFPRFFFDALALEGASDHFDPRAEKIALMTLHAAKGLEFPVVFIVGCEETLLPMQLPGLTSQLEEERRLFYVGMTRAKEQLYLLRAHRRPLFGRICENSPSRFLADIEEQLKAYEKWQAPARKVPKKRGDEDQLRLF